MKPDYNVREELARLSSIRNKERQDRNINILTTRLRSFNERQGPRVGDYLKLPNGKYTRLTHDWGDGMQTGGHETSSYYLNPSGRLSYSGSLDPSISKANFGLTTETRTGNIWFFDQDFAGAGRGVTFQIEFRVYKLIHP